MDDKEQGVIRAPNTGDSLESLFSSLMGVNYSDPTHPVLQMAMSQPGRVVGGMAGLAMMLRALQGANRMQGASRLGLREGARMRPQENFARPDVPPSRKYSDPRYQETFREGANARIDRMNEANRWYGAPPVDYEAGGASTPKLRITPGEDNPYFDVPMGMFHLNDSRLNRSMRADRAGIPEWVPGVGGPQAYPMEMMDRNTLEVFKRLIRPKEMGGGSIPRP